MRADVVFYVSGHGFGHATRSRALITALRERNPGLTVHVRSSAPQWLFQDGHAQRHPVACSEADIDVGILQRSGLDLDLRGTLAAHEDFLSRWDATVSREAAAIRDLEAGLVVADIPPAAFAAAARAGVPAVAVGNFSWDWILDGYSESEPRWRPIVAHYRDAYASAAKLYRLPMCGDFPAFARIADTPHLVNRSRHSRAQCRDRLGIARSDPRRLVVVSFGGFGGGRVEHRPDADLSGYLFTGAGDAPSNFSGSWISLPSPSEITHEDLICAADGAIGKLGYSTVAEVIAHRVRFLYLTREGFRETAVIERGLLRYGCARTMPRRDFAQGRWGEHLDALFEQPDESEPIETNGAEFIAAELVREFGLENSTNRSQ